MQSPRDGGLGSPLGFLPLERVPEVMKLFIMVQYLTMCLMGYVWVGQVASRSFSKLFFGCRAWRLKSRLVVMTYSSVESSISLLSLLSPVVTATRRGSRFCPFLLPLVPFLVPLHVALDGAARPLSGTIFLSPRTKTALTTS
jgi:hypothetical protein